MLLVKPNPRRMRAFLNSPAETSAPGAGGYGIRWERVAVAVAGVAALAGVVIALAVY